MHHVVDVTLEECCGMLTEVDHLLSKTILKDFK